MYSLTQLRRGVESPKHILREFNRLYHTRGRQHGHNPDGVAVFEEDWDNLLILDACRYDTFTEMVGNSDLAGRLEHRRSKGAATPEFIRGNLDGNDLTDTVYVTATTMLYRKTSLSSEADLRLHDIIDVWEDSIEFGEFGVLPSTMADEALATLEEYPNKRLVVHFIQPHIPFIGEKGREYFGDYDGPIWIEKFKQNLDVPDDALWEFYRENLNAVLPEVRRFLDSASGKTVVTADHGQMIGDRSSPIPIKEYGHPTGLFTEELIKVPWLVVDGDERRKITNEPPQHSYAEKSNDELDSKARDHLRHLGYVE